MQAAADSMLHCILTQSDLCCSGHQSFSNSRKLNDFVGNITHSSILVPYHGWRVSHRTHHQHHGHVENDESWHPVAKKLYDGMVSTTIKLPHAYVCILRLSHCLCTLLSASEVLHGYATVNIVSEAAVGGPPL